MIHCRALQNSYRRRSECPWQSLAGDVVLVLAVRETDPLTASLLD